MCRNCDIHTYTSENSYYCNNLGLDELPTNNGLSGSFDAFDPAVSATNNLPGLLLDSTTGWVTSWLGISKY